MNLTSILPLLMSMKGGNIDPKTLALIQAMSGGNVDKSSLLSEIAGNSNYGPILSVLSNNQKAKKSAPVGLDLIADIASDDIFGKLSRYIYRQNSSKSREK